MNFSPASTGSINTAYTLEEQYGNISIHNDSAYEYADVGSDDVLYVTQEVTGSFCYEHGTSQLDSGGNSSCSTLSGPWEYLTPDSKSLDSVVSELGPEEVRWFYKSDSDKRWLEFSGYDSLRIEFKYRQHFYEWHSYSNQENWTATDVEETIPYIQSALNVESNVSVDDGSNYSYEGASAVYTSDSEHKIVVRGGMYEVDLNEWKCKSIYWPGEDCGINRGNWFYDGSWQPLEVEQSNHMETAHLQLFSGQKLADYIPDPLSKAPKQVVHTLSFPEFHVDWYSPTEVYLYSEAASSKLVRSFTQKLGFQKPTGYRLYRGYKEPSTETDRPVDITHLVFVIHGIGQKMDTGRIIRNTSTFRDCVAWVKQKYFLTSTHRAEFFPVEWRSSLKLDGDIVEAITPHKLLGLRQILNASAMDIMYYTSPLYGSEVQRGLSEELNRLYSMFSRRNPYFEANGGKVSVIAHSLGCVIVYDIVTGWRPDSWQQVSHSRQTSASGDGASSLPDTPHSPTVQRGLLFQIDNLFCLGSPLSVFLALRWRKPQDNILPPSLCQRLYNVFHPSDPVAYRMEPLICREYSRIAPLQIQAYNCGVRQSYSALPMEPIIPEPVPAPTLPPPLKREGEESESPGGTPSKVVRVPATARRCKETHGVIWQHNVEVLVIA